MALIFFIFLFAVSKIFYFFASLKSKTDLLNEAESDFRKNTEKYLEAKKNDLFLQSQIQGNK